MIKKNITLLIRQRYACSHHQFHNTLMGQEGGKSRNTKVKKLDNRWKRVTLTFTPPHKLMLYLKPKSGEKLSFTSLLNLPLICNFYFITTKISHCKYKYYTAVTSLPATLAPEVRGRHSTSLEEDLRDLLRSRWWGGGATGVGTGVATSRGMSFMSEVSNWWRSLPVNTMYILRKCQYPISLLSRGWNALLPGMEKLNLNNRC